MQKKGRVLLIIHDVYQDDNIFPLGTGYIASALKVHGAEVVVCCQDVFHQSNEWIAQNLLKDESYDIIAFGFMAARFRETVLGLCEMINEHKKDAWLVLGAHGPSPISEYVLQTTRADIVTIGESEATIVELLDCKLSGGHDLSKIDGIAFRDGDNVTVNRRREAQKDLDLIAFPSWELFAMDKYTSCVKFDGMQDDGGFFPITTGRGCVNRCNFCYRLEDGIRFRKIDNVIAEMKILYDQFGVKHFSIQDEIFVVSKRRLFEFRDALKRSGMKITFHCDVRVDIYDEEIADCLAECGCIFSNFGLESSSQAVLDAMGKRTTVEQNERALQIAKRSGVMIGLNYLWGNIGDTEESLWKNVEMIKKYNTYYHLRTIRPPTPYPGCDLYYEAIRRGLLTGPHDFFERFKNSDLLLVNFTDIPEDKFYELLFAANKELIRDHYENTSKDLNAAKWMTEKFHSVYFEGDYNFRGVRHYENDKK